MTGLDFVLDRTVTIAARRETVFRYFTDSERFAAWWGEGSTIDPRPGGSVHIRYPNGVVAGGEVVEIAPAGAHRLQLRLRVGQADPDRRLARDDHASRRPPRGTLVKLRHELPNAAVRGRARPGLALSARASSPTWWRAGARRRRRARRPLLRAAGRETDAGKRRAELAAVAVPELSFRDPYSCTSRRSTT